MKIPFLARFREDLVEYVKLLEHGDSTSTVRKSILVWERDRIAAMQNTLDRLNA